MLRSRVCLSELAFDVAWLAAGLGARPSALTMPSPGATFAERRQLEEQAWSELHRAGLTRHGALDGDVAAAIGVLDRAAYELYGYFAAAEEKPWSVTVAVRGDTAVLARVDNGTVTMESIRPTNVCEALLATLPALGKASGTALSAPQNIVNGAERSSDSILQRSGGPEGDARAAERMRAALARPRLGGGQFYSARRDRWGKRTRNATVVSVVDTVDGRYLAETRRNAHGEPWAMLVPADGPVLVNAFETLLAAG